MSYLPGQHVIYRQGDGLPKLGARIIRYYPSEDPKKKQPTADLRVMTEDGEDEFTVRGSEKNGDVGGWQDA